jgi:hypothetical protein
VPSAWSIWLNNLMTYRLHIQYSPPVLTAGGRRDTIHGNWREPIVSATTKAITAIVIFAVTQLTLVLYSCSHPSIDGFVTASFLLGMVFHGAVFDYHARKMTTSGKR